MPRQNTRAPWCAPYKTSCAPCVPRDKLNSPWLVMKNMRLWRLAICLSYCSAQKRFFWSDCFDVVCVLGVFVMPRALPLALRAVVKALLLLGSLSFREIASRSGVSLGTVYNIHHSHASLHHGLRRRTGRPRSLSNRARRQLLRQVTVLRHFLG